MYRLCRCMWIPTKKSLAISTGNRYQPVRKFVSSGANFRVPSSLAQNPQILRDRLTHSCVSRGGKSRGHDAGRGKKKWSRTTVESILTNEKYKGHARLQKSFTVDFLTKKTSPTRPA